MFMRTFSFSCLILLSVFLSYSAPAAAQSASSKPLKLVELDCMNNIADSCIEAALRYHEGKGVAKNPAKTEYYVGRACATKNAIACTTYATLLYDKPTPDMELIGDYAWRGCNLGDIDGCKLAVSFASSDDPWIQDASKRKEVAQKSCNAGDAKGCTLLSSLNQPKPAPQQTAQTSQSGNGTLSAAELKAYVKASGDYAGATDYVVSIMPYGKGAFQDSPIGDALGELIVEAGPNGVKNLSDYAIEQIFNNYFWQYNPPASRIIAAEWKRRKQVDRATRAREENDRRRLAQAEQDKRNAANASYVGTAGTGRTGYTPKSGSGTSTCRVWTGVYAATVCTPD